MALCIAVIGRPNVGKSSLFNLYTHSQQAIVVDQPGVTRDRQIKATHYQNKPFTLIDTASLSMLSYRTNVLAKAIHASGKRFDASKAHSALYDAQVTARLFCDILHQQ